MHSELWRYQNLYGTPVRIVLIEENLTSVFENSGNQQYAC